MSTSKLQQETSSHLRLLLTGYNVQENYRPDWLTNPETSRPLEIDFWIPDVKIAIEVQGIQHRQYVPWFHASPRDFEAQLKRDELKRSILEANGVHFYEITSPADIDTFIEQAKPYCFAFAKELQEKNSALRWLSYCAAKLFEKVAHRRRSKSENQELASLLKRAMHISEKYGIPLASIKPDYTVTKFECGHFRPDGTHAKVKLLRRDGVTIRTENAVMNPTGADRAHLVWDIRKYERSDGRNFEEGEFDLVTGWQIKDDFPKWKIKGYPDEGDIEGDK